MAKATAQAILELVRGVPLDVVIGAEDLPGQQSQREIELHQEVPRRHGVRSEQRADDPAGGDVEQCGGAEDQGRGVPARPDQRQEPEQQVIEDDEIDGVVRLGKVSRGMKKVKVRATLSSPTRSTGTAAMRGPRCPRSA